MQGNIIQIYRNFGIIESKVNGHSVEFMFYIFPDMISNKKYTISNKVTFETTKAEVRDSKLLVAYNVKPFPGSNIKQYPINIPEIKAYPDDIYKEFFKIRNDEALIKRLVAEDERFGSFTLKLVLFLENRIRKIIVQLITRYKIKRSSIYNSLADNKETKVNHKKIFKILGQRYKFRTEFNYLTIKRQSAHDDINFKVTDAPISLYLENTTLDKLSSIVKVLCSDLFKNINEKDNNFRFLKLSFEMFDDVSIIRNASAHDRPLIPLILDDNYAPNVFYDLFSVDPKFNAGTDVTQWKLFQPIRYISRQITKEGYAPNYFDGNLQNTGLYTAKYILSNPARRSFFSFIYMLELYFRIVNKDRKTEFLKELNTFVPIYNSIPIDDYLFAKYPKENPVLKQFIEFTYPLWWDETFWLIVVEGILM